MVIVKSLAIFVPPNLFSTDLMKCKVPVAGAGTGAGAGIITGAAVTTGRGGGGVITGLNKSICAQRECDFPAV